MYNYQTSTTDKSSLELRKLEAEASVALKRDRNYRREQRIEVLKVTLSLLTILGIAVTYYSQSNQLKISQQQLEIIQRQHSDNALASDIQNLTVANLPTAKIVAVSKLLGRADNDSAVRQELIRLLLAYYEAEESFSVSSYLRRELCSRQPSIVLRHALDRNRELTENGKFVVKSSDEVRKNIYLVWDCVAKLKRIRDFDFSHTILNVFTIYSLNDSQEPNHFVSLNYIPEIEGVTFENVRFDNANIPRLQFVKDTFLNVSFIETDLTGTGFIKSVFKNCSFVDVSTFISADNLSDSLRQKVSNADVAPLSMGFVGCSLELKKFSINEPLSIQTYKNQTIDDVLGSAFSKWQIDEAPPSIRYWADSINKVASMPPQVRDSIRVERIDKNGDGKISWDELNLSRGKEPKRGSRILPKKVYAL